MNVVLESVLTCSHCAFTAQETMRTDACQYLFECRNCKSLLRPKPGGWRTCPDRRWLSILTVLYKSA